MFSRFADWLIAHAKKTPYFDLEGYMERWWVIKPRSWLPFASRIHHILRSDLDRHLHDHPWPYLTVILKGGYWEVTFAFQKDLIKSSRKYIFFHDDTTGIWFKKRYYGPGSILFRRPGTFHRLIVEHGQTAWTWFTVGPHVQKWGFLTEDKGKVWWREYLNDWDSEHSGSPFRLDGKNESARQNNSV